MIKSVSLPKADSLGPDSGIIAVPIKKMQLPKQFLDWTGSKLQIQEKSALLGEPILLPF